MHDIVRALPARLAAVSLLGAVCLTLPTPAPAMAQTDIEQIRIEVDSMVFDARASGPRDGPLVLMLHGFPQSSFEWRHQIPTLAALGFRVVAPDQRGYSPGARPDRVAAYAVPHLVADVIGIADALDRQAFHVVGHDWGAAVTWFAALLHPDRVESIVPISVPHPYAFSQALADPEGQQARMSGYMQTFRADSAAAMFLADDAAMLRGIYGGAQLGPQEVQQYVDLLGTPDAMNAALNWYRAMDLTTEQGRVTPIRMPTTFVWSTEDVALGSEGAHLTEQFVEGPYRFEVFEDIGHWVPEQASEELNRVLLEHFRPFVR